MTLVVDIVSYRSVEVIFWRAALLATAIPLLTHRARARAREG